MSEPELSIRSADRSRDGADVNALCCAYRDVLVESFARFAGLIELYDAKPDYAALLDALPRIHARPKGDILLACLGCKAVGCAMYYPLPEPGLCEIKRVHVAREARGGVAGRKLTEAAMAQAAADGHRRMVLDTIVDLHAAIALYEGLAFTPAASFYDVAPGAAPLIRFFGKDLPGAR